MANPSPDFPGVVNSGYITAKMPSWAGVPQNIVGRNLHGEAMLETNARATARASVEQTTLLLTVSQLRTELESMLVRLRSLEEAVTQMLPPALR